MWNKMKKDKFFVGVCIVSFIIFLIVASLVISGILHVYRFLKEDGMTTEEWSVMMLEDYQEDIEAAISDLQARQEKGIETAYVHKYDGEPLEVSLSSQDSYTTEILTGNQTYEQLIKKCVHIDLQISDAISFSRRGFLRGYTGFYYSPTGEEKDVSGGAEWYKTGHLQGNYFWYEFGYD